MMTLRTRNAGIVKGCQPHLSISPHYSFTAPMDSHGMIDKRKVSASDVVPSTRLDGWFGWSNL